MWEVETLLMFQHFTVLSPLLDKRRSSSSTVQSIVAAKVNYFGGLEELGLLG